MDDKTVGMPVLSGFLKILDDIDKTGKDVLMCSLLHWWKTDDSFCQAMVLPPYLFKKYEKCVKELKEYLARRAN